MAQHRYELDSGFYFTTPSKQTQFANAVATYMSNHPNMFIGETPINRDQVDHAGLHYQKVSAHFAVRADLDTVFNMIVTQATNRGAIAPSWMWLKEVDPDVGVIAEQDWTA